MSAHTKHLLDQASRACLLDDDQHADSFMELYIRSLKREGGK